jgi:hypothetical protein
MLRKQNFKPWDLLQRFGRGVVCAWHMLVGAGMVVASVAALLFGVMIVSDDKLSTIYILFALSFQISGALILFLSGIFCFLYAFDREKADNFSKNIFSSRAFLLLKTLFWYIFIISIFLLLILFIYYVFQTVAIFPISIAILLGALLIAIAIFFTVGR